MKILFVCKRNEFRSPIAEAIASKILGKENVCSAGTFTRAQDNTEALKLTDREHQKIYCKFIEDQGYEEFGEYRPKKVTNGMINWADIVVDMMESEYDLEMVRLNPKTIKWEIENPNFKNLNEIDGYKKAEEIYNILKKNIIDLINAK
ncbi:MAG: hypothetical protein JWP09_171 [Candidatus Taylorbacteria bacterium]|nr:hypothetical protein [Candidatus Taylorbacteria bacterium]